MDTIPWSSISYFFWHVNLLSSCQTLMALQHDLYSYRTKPIADPSWCRYLDIRTSLWWPRLNEGSNPRGAMKSVKHRKQHEVAFEPAITLSHAGGYSYIYILRPSTWNGLWSVKNMRFRVLVSITLVPPKNWTVKMTPWWWYVGRVLYFRDHVRYSNTVYVPCENHLLNLNRDLDTQNARFQPCTSPPPWMKLEEHSFVPQPDYTEPKYHPRFCFSSDLVAVQVCHISTHRSPRLDVCLEG